MKKENNVKTILIMFILIVVLVFISFLLGSLINKFYANEKTTKETNSKDNINNYESPYKKISIDLNKLEIKKEKTDESTNNIKVENKFYINGEYNQEVLVLVKNENNYAVELRGTLNFYDKDEYNVDYSTDVISVVYPNAEAVLTIRPSTNYEDYESIKTYDFTYQASKIKSYYESVNIKPDEINTVKTEREIIASYNNNTGKEISNIKLVCLYYKNNNLVMAKAGTIFDTKAGLSGSATFYNSSVDIDYNDYKIVVTGAYIYNKDWK